MLLTITTMMPLAGDLGFLVHKHPDKAQSFSLPVGTAHVVWPEVSDERSTVALLLEVDPIALVRGRRDEGFSLAQYVNDRPYASSSMFAVALGTVFRTALAGICKARPGLAAQEIPLELRLPAVPSRGADDLLTRLFGPLGWAVEATPVPLDPAFPSWGDSPYVDLTLTGTHRLADALTQLYVLLPVLDDGKHYWVGADEVDKLLRFGAGWLPDHPERELITRRYLRHQRSLVLSATERLTEADDEVVPDDEEPRTRPLAAVRAAAVIAALHAERASTVVDLGCGEGALLRELIGDASFARVLGVDVSHRALETATKRLGLERMPDTQRTRLELLQSSVTYRDDRLAGHDAVVLMEVIEHVDPARLPALERTVLGHARPVSVIVTTPNADYNVLYPFLEPGHLRHPDHRFEWTRAEFQHWAATTAAAYGYAVRFLPVGVEDLTHGAPTQMAVFRRAS
ncbi:3' terminal RNA ribose 2'-O-methyltransferase Hen1 [Acidothermaceae bacterium B102]|nr:3' terminal RNA ribose 2'-O-methyltransferase Hen1 [Acidothermaceae bacterium B102]